MRNDHYNNYIGNNEDKGHKFFKQSLIYILSDFEEKYEYWSKMKYETLEDTNDSDEENDSIEESIDDFHENFHFHEDFDCQKDLFNNSRQKETFDIKFLDILSEDHQLFQAIKDNNDKIIIKLSELTENLLFSYLPILYGKKQIEFMGSNQERYEICKKYIYIAKPLYICILSKDPKMKLFFLTIICQFCETIKDLSTIINKLDVVLCIFLYDTELIYLFIDIAKDPFLSTKIFNIQKIYKRLIKLLNERRTISAEIIDNLSATCEYLIKYTKQLVCSITPSDKPINRYSIFELKIRGYC